MSVEEAVKYLREFGNLDAENQDQEKFAEAVAVLKENEDSLDPAEANLFLRAEAALNQAKAREFQFFGFGRDTPQDRAHQEQQREEAEGNLALGQARQGATGLPAALARPDIQQQGINPETGEPLVAPSSMTGQGAAGPPPPPDVRDFIGLPNMQVDPATGTPVGVDPRTGQPIEGQTQGLPQRTETVDDVLTPNRNLARERTRTVPPQYKEGDQLKFSGRNPVEIKNMQERLVQAGVLKEGSFWPGVWDAESQKAYKEVLAYANQSGATDDEMIARLVTAGGASAVGAGVGGATDVSGFVAEPYLAPDYDSLADGVRTYMEQELGRDVRDEEVKALADKMGADHLAAYQAQLGKARMMYDARLQAAETGEEAGGGTVQDVDPVASFHEEFRKKYKPEIETEQREDEVAQTAKLTLQSITGLDRMI